MIPKQAMRSVPFSMKCIIFLFFALLSSIAFAQKNKSFFLFTDPVSIAFRNPTIGLEIGIKKSFIDAIQLDGSYMIQDKRIGGFLKKGFESERSTLSNFESYPMNRLPFYVYNGPGFHIGALNYFYSKSFHQYISLSITGRVLHYDSLEVQYNNTPRVKRESLFEPSAHYEHFRYQNEQMQSWGLGFEYGIRKSKENIIFNFFIRGNMYYSIRNITSYNEQYNYFINGDLNSSSKDGLTHNNTYSLLQFRPQIGCRIGLSNFD